MKPDSCDAPAVCLSHDVGRGIRVGGNNDAIDRARYRREIRVAINALELSGVRVDRYNLVPARTELSEDRVGRLLRRSRHSGDHNPATGKEARNRLWTIRHKRPQGEQVAPNVKHQRARADVSRVTIELSGRALRCMR